MRSVYKYSKQNVKFKRIFKMPTSNSDPQTNGCPEWFTRQYLQDALRLALKDDTVKIVKFEVNPACANGENYVSEMFRVRVQYMSEKSKNIRTGSYVLKAAQKSGSTKEAIDTYGAYQHEIHMYDKIFPKFTKILRNIGYGKDFAPRILTVNHAQESLVFEDLSPLGYQLADVKQGLDESHTKLVLDKIALFHAASAVLNDLESGEIDQYDRGIFNKHSRSFDPFFNQNFEACARKVCTWEGYEVYGEKMLNILPYFIKYAVEAMEPKPNHFKALIHGDLWCNNFMFKYDKNKKPLDVILLDFQFTAWTSPTVDLHYFLQTSLEDELRSNKMEDFVHFYFLRLVIYLKDLKYRKRIPSLQDFWIQFMETSFYAYVSSVISQPMMILDGIDDPSIQLFMQNTAESAKARDILYNNPRIKKNLQKWLPIFDRRGLLDVRS